MPDTPSTDLLTRLLPEVEAGVAARSTLTQVTIDTLFSYAELGFQEVETSAYLVRVLSDHGFSVEVGVAGIPTAWWASWGSGRPVIAFGSDLDGIPKASQRPGVAHHAPLVEGAPGHGEGHNSGQAVNLAAALALKEVMEREGLEGTIVLWPGVAEEQLGGKAWLVREGCFDDVDVCLFSHVGKNLEVAWGTSKGSGLVSVEFTFHGEAAHAGSAPWKGRSALDGVELMDAGWAMWRERLHPGQRSHRVVTDGGDQPNVVPSRASVWYYLRETEVARIRENLESAIRISQGAALMSDTRVEHRLLGAAWPRHFNRPVAEAMFRHIGEVGLPEWSEEDQLLARAVQLEVGSEPSGLAVELADLGVPVPEAPSGGSDDIGDVSWTVPTVTLRYPSNIPDLPGHHWADAIAMATPIAHKGAVAGARVLARTALELVLRPDLVREARGYFTDEQAASETYNPFIGPDDPPATHLNRETMAAFRPALAAFHFDADRHPTYLDQLGVTYPTLRPDQLERLTG